MLSVVLCGLILVPTIRMYVDDLPIWGIVGDMDENDPNSYFIYTHKRFDFGINKDRIVGQFILSKKLSRCSNIVVI